MIPLIINYPEPMYRMRLASMKDATPATLDYLQKSGILHVEPAGELSDKEKSSISEDKELITKALSQTRDLFASLETVREITIPSLNMDNPISQMASLISTVHKRCSKLMDKRKAIEADISGIKMLVSYLGPLADVIDLTFQDLNYNGAYLFTKTVVFSRDGYRHFLEKASNGLIHHITADIDDEIVALVVARADTRGFVEKIISDLRALELRMPKKNMLVNTFLRDSISIMDALAGQAHEITVQLTKTIEDKLVDLAAFREALKDGYERITVLEQLSSLHYATVIEGWVPMSRRHEITSLINTSTDYHILEMTEPALRDEPPSKLRNPAPIRPFQVIVNLFSIPRYNDWDPTPVVAYFFAFFFGLMLNDTVYALGLILMARFFLDRLVDDPDSPGVHLFRNVLFISGTVALIFGLFSGTHLGDFFNRYLGIDLQRLALVVWVQKQLSDPINFVIFSLLIGMVHVNIAHILGLIRGARKKNTGVVLSKIGLFITEAFGIPYILRALLNIDLLGLTSQTYDLFVYPLAAGLALIIISSFMQMRMLGALFWIFDLTGFLGDIMSYSRLAGVGLATYYLASSFNLLSQWFSSLFTGLIPGIAGLIMAFILGTVLLVVLHTFNMLLSSLAAFIHSLRLCFVEFLMKFYEGGGREYAPFGAHQHKKVVLVGTRS